MSDISSLFALKTGLQPVRQHLSVARSLSCDKSDVVFSLDCALQMLELCESQMESIYAQESDEFNSLVDQSNDDFNKIQALEIKLNLIIKDMAELKQRSDKEIGKLQQTLSDTQSAHKTMAAEYRKLKLLQPEKLQANVAKLKKAVAEKKNDIAQQRTHINDLSKRFGTLQSQHDGMKLSHDDLLKRLVRHDGEPEGENFQNNGSALSCSIYAYEYGLTFQPQNNGVVLLNDLDWHYMIKTSYGINVNVMVSDYLCPIWPICTEIAAEWPAGIYNELKQRIHARMATTHPHLVKRVDLAKETPVQALSLPQDLEQHLLAAGVHKLYDIVSKLEGPLTDIINQSGGTNIEVSSVLDIINRARKHLELKVPNPIAA